MAEHLQSWFMQRYNSFKEWFLLAFCFAIYSMLVSLSPAPSLYKMAAMKVLGHLLTHNNPQHKGDWVFPYISF